jgi:transcription termination/antitermination protein NusG
MSEECRWFAVRVRSNFESKVSKLLPSYGFDAYLPKYVERRRWSDRYKNTDVPLFSGYVFCRLREADFHGVTLVPGVLHIVGVGKTPAPLDPQEVEAIQRTLETGLPVRAWDFLSVGQQVRLVSGPLTGLRGTLVAWNQEHRLVLSVTVLQRAMAVEVSPSWVLPAEGKPRTSISLQRGAAA